MKDAHNAESNEKSVFRFLFFELSPIVVTIYQKITDQMKKFFKSDSHRRPVLMKIFFIRDIYKPVTGIFYSKTPCFAGGP